MHGNIYITRKGMDLIMIPYAIFCAKLDGNGFKALEVRALDMSVEGFTFRISNRYRDNIQYIKRIILHFYCFNESGYRELILDNDELNDKEDKRCGQGVKNSINTRKFSIKEEESTEFYTIYRFITDDPTYQQYSGELSIVVNDWGMLSILKKSSRDWFEISLGILLCKRRKDVRMKYWHCNNNCINNFSDYEEAECFEDHVDYFKHLNKDFGISRYSLESGQELLADSYENKIWNNIKKQANVNVTLHLPFFQMNTSQFCTLNAQIKHNDRGSQRKNKECSYYCNDKVFLYSEALNMIGRYNSLFGYDADILAESTQMKKYLEQGIDRIVIGLL